MPIITDNNIDEEEAEEWLSAKNTIDFLPGIPENLTVKDAAGILAVSELTIIRMVEDHQIQLNKQSILDYINQNYLVNRPLNLTQNSPDCPK
ncbi:MAG: hypothetical protein VZR56_02865 [Treponema sp.]|nr:hypothetical protein [Treponema sp.]